MKSNDDRQVITLVSRLFAKQHQSMDCLMLICLLIVYLVLLVVLDETTTLVCLMMHINAHGVVHISMSSMLTPCILNYRRETFSLCTVDNRRSFLHTTISLSKNIQWSRFFVEQLDIVKYCPTTLNTLTCPCASTHNAVVVQSNGSEGNTNRVFVQGIRWPVMVVIDNMFTKPKLRRVQLHHTCLGNIVKSTLCSVKASCIVKSY